MSNGRTLWEEGRQPGRQVVTLAAVVTGVVVALNLLLSGELGLFFDLAFIGVCAAAALSVRPRDFFVVGVSPPLLMLGVVLILALVARGAVAEEADGLIQAVVSGLAHRAGGLIAGYGLTLAVLAVRQATVQKRRAASDLTSPTGTSSALT